MNRTIVLGLILFFLILILSNPVYSESQLEKDLSKKDYGIDWQKNPDGTVVFTFGFSPKFFENVVFRSNNWMEYYKIIYHKKDPNFDIEVISFNESNFEFKLKVSKEFEKEFVPLHYKDEKQEFTQLYKINSPDGTFNLDLNPANSIIQFGSNSTIIEILPNTNQKVWYKNICNIIDPDDADTEYTSYEIINASDDNRWMLETSGCGSGVYYVVQRYDINISEIEYVSLNWFQTCYEGYKNYGPTVQVLQYNFSSSSWFSTDNIDEFPDDTYCYNSTNFNDLFSDDFMKFGTKGSRSGGLTTYYTDFVNVTISYVTDPIHPFWSLNSTNSTVGGTPVSHNVFWQDNNNLSAYIFSWHNGTNWSDVSCSEQMDQENCEIYGCTWSGEENTLSYYDTFEVSLGNWSQWDGDDDDWERDSGGTPSSGTGCSSGQDGSTWYMYIETSNGEPDCYDAGDTVILWISDEINFDNYTSEFFNISYHMYGSSMGTLYLEHNTSGSWVSLWSKTQNINAWYDEIIDLSDITGTGNLRLSDVCVGGYEGDMCIDNLRVSGDYGSCSGSSNYYWKNDTAISFGSTNESWSNITKTIADSGHIAWKVYANDSANNWNETDVFNYTPTELGGEQYDRNGTLSMTLALVKNRIFDGIRTKSLSIDLTENGLKKAIFLRTKSLDILLFDPPDDDLALLFHLNNDSAYGENNTHVYDFSGNNNNGTIYDDTQVYPTLYGKYEGGFEMWATDDYPHVGIVVDDSNSLDITETLTLAGWMKMTGTLSDSDLVFKANAYYIYQQPLNSTHYTYTPIVYVGLDIGDIPNSASVNVTYNDWHHLALTYNGSHVKSYVDGDYKGIYYRGGSIDTNDYTMAIGENTNATIDEVRVYNRTLSDSEIYKLYETESIKIYDARKTISFPVSLTENGYRQADFQRTKSLSITITDEALASAEQIYSRLVSLGLTLTESISRIADFTRSKDLSMTLTESASGIKTGVYSRLLSLSLTLAESGSRIADFERLKSLSFTLTESGLKRFQKNIVKSLSLSLSESGLKKWQRNIEKSLGLTFSLSGSISGVTLERIIDFVMNLAERGRAYIQEWVEQTNINTCAILMKIGESRAYLCVYEDATWKVLIKGIE